MIVLNSLLMALECFFGGSLVLALALLLSRGQPASQRHLILTGAFAVLLALPLASLLLPSHLVWQLAAAQPAAVPQAAMAQVAIAHTPASFDWGMILLGFATLWAMGVIFVLSKAVFGAVALAELYRSSVPHIPEGLSPEKFRGLNWQLRIRTMPGDAGPITWGLLRPVVLLPKSSVTWSRARLEAVLLHEAAHVRRQDCLTRLIAVIACALYWPNPLVWMAARIMRRDGETAADDVVLSTGIKASAYAEHLVGLARAFASSRPSYAGVSLAMAEPAMLDARVEAILNPTRSRRALHKSDVLKIAALGLTATAVIALARPSLAEAKAVAEPSPLVAPASSAQPARIIAAAPDAPSAVDAPPEPPAPPALAVPPAPPAPPAVAHAPKRQSHFTMRWKTDDGIDKVWEGSTASDHAEAERDLAQAQAEHARAVAQEKAHAHQATVRVNLADVQREHAADFAQAQAEIAKAQVHVHEALAKANISQVVSIAIDKAVSQALKETQRALAKAKVDITVKVNDNTDGDDAN